MLSRMRELCALVPRIGYLASGHLAPVLPFQ